MKKAMFLAAAGFALEVLSPVATAQTSTDATQQVQTSQPDQTATPSPTATQTSAPTDAAPAASTESPPLPAADEKAHLIFFRPGRLSGMIYTYHVRETGEDGKVSEDSPRIGDLPNQGFFRVDADPGIHNYNISGPMEFPRAQDRVRVELEAGETYYFEQSQHIGVFTSSFILVPSDQAHFDQDHLHEAPQQAATQSTSTADH